MGNDVVQRAVLHDPRGRRLRHSFRPRAVAAFAAALLVTTAGCDDWLHPPATEGEAGLVLTFAQGTGSGGAGAAFDAADNLAVDLRVDGETLVSETIPVSAGGGSIEARLDVFLPSGAASGLVSVDVRRASDDLFTGSTTVEVVPGEETVATIVLSPVVHGVDLTPPPVFTVFGQTADLEGYAVFATGDVVPGVDVTWISLNTDVVVVRQVGGQWRAEAVADGTATLRGSAGGLTGTVDAAVDVVVTDVEVLPSSSTLRPGGTLDLTAILRDAGGNLVPGRTPTWTSDDLSVATVSATGVVTAMAVGATDIRASEDGASGAATVTVQPPGPEVATLPPTGVTGSGAAFRATVDPVGSTTTVVFEYGTDPSLTTPSVTPPSTVSGSAGPTEVVRAVTGLAGGTTYYVRAVASNSLGTARGDVVSFATPDVPTAPSGLTGTYIGGVRLSWQDNSNNETRFEIEWEYDESQGEIPPPPARVYDPIGSVGPDVSSFDDDFPVTGEQRYRVRACNDDGCSEWTPPLTWFHGLPPLVLTRPASNVSWDQATIAAFVNPLNAPTQLYWQVSYDGTFTTPPPDVFPTSPFAVGEGNVDVFRQTLAGNLSPGLTYYVRAIAISPWGMTIGNVVSFMTDVGG